MISIAASRTGRHLQRYIDGCRQVVGCIPYRFRKKNQSFYGSSIGEEDIEVLLVSSQKGQAWLFPKGGWENDESIEIAARRETLEEAGVVGDVKSELGRWRYKSKSQEIFHDGYMFSLLVKEQLEVWPEKDARRRVWMTMNEARERCPHSWMREALDVFELQLIHLRQQEHDENDDDDDDVDDDDKKEDGSNCAMEFLMSEEQRASRKKGGDDLIMCYNFVC
ncbi:nudix hydrolase 18, mitochondrial-like [Impatiens glandulifera]|uniref:nudix hydrolase 18, mitochondrial-like n=1 Tax=Impatiens glandulifera TaxID=253017 RepID=UPI001FB14142|nr:nudix hydrolase 18, mitochondrial-like [Impatiens glandulifera]